MRLLFVIIMVSVYAHAHEGDLSQRLTEYLATLPASAKVNMQVERLEGKVLFARFPHDEVPSASIIKIPILVALMEQVKQSKISLSDVYRLKAADKVGGAGSLYLQPDNTAVTYEQLARAMIESSDNMATNILIRTVGREHINQRMRQLGLKHLHLNRYMMDTAAVARGIDNFVSPNDINHLLRLIYDQRVATPALCKKMMQFLLDNDDVTTLPSGLPKATKIAHKTGGLAYVRGDAGIVFAHTPFVITVLVRGVSIPEAEKIIGEIGRICYLHFN